VTGVTDSLPNRVCTIYE